MSSNRCSQPLTSLDDTDQNQTAPLELESIEASGVELSLVRGEPFLLSRAAGLYLSFTK